MASFGDADVMDDSVFNHDSKRDLSGSDQLYVVVSGLEPGSKDTRKRNSITNNVTPNVELVDAPDWMNMRLEATYDGSGKVLPQHTQQ